MILRNADEADLPALMEIYNHEIETSTATFDTEPKHQEAYQAWLHAHNIGNHPLIVAESEGKAVGYASLSPYRNMAAYDSTVELSVYVSPSHRGQGIASALMAEILARACADSRTHLIVSVITDGNLTSDHLHEKFGFSHCGSLRECGIKFGGYLSVHFYALIV